MALNLPTDEVFLTTEEVLAYLQVNLRTVYRLIKAGKIPAVRVGRQWRFRKRDIDAWLDSQRTQSGGAVPVPPVPVPWPPLPLPPLVAPPLAAPPRVEPPCATPPAPLDAPPLPLLALELPPFELPPVELPPLLLPPGVPPPLPAVALLPPSAPSVPPFRGEEQLQIKVEQRTIDFATNSRP